MARTGTPTDAAMCIGHPREPVDELVYRIAALRWPEDLAGALPADRPILFATEEILVPVPGFRGKILNLMEDRRGNVWMCTEGAGLWQVSSNLQARHWSPSNGTAR